MTPSKTVASNARARTRELSHRRVQLWRRGALPKRPGRLTRLNMIRASRAGAQREVVYGGGAVSTRGRRSGVSARHSQLVFDADVLSPGASDRHFEGSHCRVLLLGTTHRFIKRLASSTRCEMIVVIIEVPRRPLHSHRRQSK